MKLSMIYMASGFGKRFGSNKLLASFEGRPLYTYGLSALEKGAQILEKKSGISCEIITVSQYPQILESARCLISGEKVLENPFSEEGITASIRLGVAAAGRYGCIPFFCGRSALYGRRNDRFFCGGLF